MEKVLLEKKGHVAVITLNDTKVLNALSYNMVMDIKEAFETVKADKDVYAVILTGAGKAFAAGADITYMQNMTPMEAYAWAKTGNIIFRGIEVMEKPVIAAVNGFALGGGCELAMSCDFIYASEKAKFGQPEVGLGVTPGFGGTQRLSRAIGPRKAKELCYTGKVIGAEEAKELGLVNAVVPAEELMDKAMATAEMICAQAPIAVKQCKMAINHGVESHIRDGIEFECQLFGNCFSTEDQTIGMKAFVEKAKEKNFVNK